MAYYFTHESLNHTMRSNHQNPDAQLSELAIFDAPAVQSEVESVYYQKVHCTEASLDTSNNEVVFEAPPTNEPMALSDSYMCIKAKLQKTAADGTTGNPLATDMTGITNLALYALFRGKSITS